MLSFHTLSNTQFYTFSNTCHLYKKWSELCFIKYDAIYFICPPPSSPLFLKFQDLFSFRNRMGIYICIQTQMNKLHHKFYDKQSNKKWNINMILIQKITSVLLFFIALPDKMHFKCGAFVSHSHRAEHHLLQHLAVTAQLRKLNTENILSKWAHALSSHRGLSPSYRLKWT